MRRRSLLLLAAVAAVVLCFPVADGAADLTTPSITSSTPASPANENAPKLNGTAVPLATVDVYTDASCAGTRVAETNADPTGVFNVPVTVADDSSTTFYASATDPTGTSACSSGFTYVEDSTPPPAPAITSHPPALTNATTATFAFGDGEAGVTYQCSTDAGFAPCTSPASYSLAEGGHTFQVRAVDAAGNASAPTSYSWTIDTTPPAAPTITSGPTGVVATNSATFTFSDTDAVASYSCQLDGGPPTDCSSGSMSYSSLPDASHTFSVTATDAAGNPSQASPRTWTVDTTPPPPPTIDTVPTDPSGSTDASFPFHSNEEGVSYACRLDTPTFTPCSSPKDYTGLADGRHTFQVQAADAVGNVSTSAPFSWTIDTAHPLVSVTDKPPLLTNQTRASFSFSATPAPARYECLLDGAAFATCSSPRLYTGLADGSHTFSVRTVSAGGTAGAATSYTWTIDTVAPETSIGSAPPASSNSTTATFSFTSSEAGSSFFCSLDASGFAPCTSPTTYTGLGNGTYTFRVQAVDPAGNADATPATYTWTIAGVGPPIVDLKPPTNVGRLRPSVGYARLQLRWSRPPDADFDHVGVYVSTSPRTAPRKLVYSGAAQSYTDRHFKNGTYYRYLVVSYDHAKNASGGSSAVVTPSALLTAPRSGSVVRRSPAFRWAAVRGASFYNIQVFYRGSKVLSAWPKRPRQSLARRWTYLGHGHALRSGTYVWYVWPGFGRATKSRYGQLLGVGSFRVR